MATPSGMPPVFACPRCGGNNPVGVERCLDCGFALRRGPNVALIALIVGLGVLVLGGALLAVFLQVVARARAQEREVGCASNVRQVVLAAHMYALDYDGNLPPADSWAAALKPYLAGQQNLFRCPAAPGQAVAYAFNSAVAGLPLDSLPPNTVLFFETSKNEPNPADAGESIAARHPRGTAYGFADGHVDITDEPQQFQPPLVEG